MPPRTRLSLVVGDDGATPRPRVSYAEAPSDQDDYEIVGSQRRRKRDADGRPVGVHLPKAGKKRRGKRTSAAETVSSAPLDGLPAEILQFTFGLLDHEDLEALTHTNRALRSLLLTRATGLVIYRRVFARLFAAGLPVPPPQLSLPAYASLLSLRTCSVRLIGLVSR